MKKYHFRQINSAKSSEENPSGLRKFFFQSEEHNNDLFLFLWIDAKNEPTKFQFFFFDKVVEWLPSSKLTFSKSNRADSPSEEDQIGVQKGARNLQTIGKPSYLVDALVIVRNSVFPLGIKYILISKMYEGVFGNKALYNDVCDSYLEFIGSKEREKPEIDEIDKVRENQRSDLHQKIKECDSLISQVEEWSLPWRELKDQKSLLKKELAKI